MDIFEAHDKLYNGLDLPLYETDRRDEMAMVLYIWRWLATQDRVVVNLNGHSVEGTRFFVYMHRIRTEEEQKKRDSFDRLDITDDGNEWSFELVDSDMYEAMTKACIKATEYLLETNASGV